ncbi:hypothetical protein CAEBREN_10794 [Caenorhabditis brenneri]|uniref:G-protein coupled receptors family 1 profile domain-containing protein n=1 Tax=Caenorhabditis brenneri TaxID=135651 RepID=G0NN18_CAEBE|nr:hypothetical protein CAEBREN_10794 [Caenorhabditis brenneri]
MFGNFPFGSIFVISVFSYFHAITVELEDMFFVTVTCLAIVVLNIFTFRKLRRTRSLSNLKSASQSANIERTLTGTMIILLVPLLFHFLIATLIMFQVFNAAPALVSHLVIVRHVFLDIRVHTATVYFYWTHPIFRSQKKAVNVSSTQIVRI